MTQIEAIVSDRVHRREKAKRDAEAKKPTYEDMVRADKEERARNLPLFLEIEQAIIRMLLDDINQRDFAYEAVSNRFLVYKKGLIFGRWVDEGEFAYSTLFHDGEYIHTWASWDHVVLRRDGKLFVENEDGDFELYRHSINNPFDVPRSLHDNAAHRVHTLFEYVKKAKKQGLLSSSFDHRAFKNLFKVLDDSAYFDIGASSLLPKARRGYQA